MKYDKADIQKTISVFLFQQSEYLKDTILRLTRETFSGNSACVHIRIGKIPLMPNDRLGTNENAISNILNFLKEYDQKGYLIHIMTDSLSVKIKAKNIFNIFVYNNHKICHIDDSNCDCEGFQNMLFDFLLLHNPVCDVLVVGQSDFSIKAAFLRNTSPGTFCMRRNSVIPCSRYTLKNIYRLWFRPFAEPKRCEYQLLL